MSPMQENRFMASYQADLEKEIIEEGEAVNTLIGLGDLYHAGANGRIKNIQKAMKYYEAAIKIYWEAYDAVYKLARIYQYDQFSDDSKLLVAKNIKLSAYFFSILTAGLKDNEEVGHLYREDLDLKLHSNAAYCLAHLLLKEESLVLDKEISYIQELNLEIMGCDYDVYKKFTNAAQRHKFAIALLKLAAKYDHAKSRANLFKFYSEGKYVEKDEKRALSYTEKTKSESDTSKGYGAIIISRSKMTLEYEKEFIATLDHKLKAGEISESEGGSTLVALGKMYEEGTMRAINLKQAINYYEKAIVIKQFDILGVYHLAKIYLNDHMSADGKIIVAKNINIAAFLFIELVAKYGSESTLAQQEIQACIDAVFHVAKIRIENHGYGTFSHKDIGYLQEIFGKSIELKLSQYSEGKIFRLGRLGAETIVYLRLAAKRGHAQACLLLSKIYSKGLVIGYLDQLNHDHKEHFAEKDDREAAFYYAEYLKYSAEKEEPVKKESKAKVDEGSLASGFKRSHKEIGAESADSREFKKKRIEAPKEDDAIAPAHAGAGAASDSSASHKITVLKPAADMSGMELDKAILIEVESKSGKGSSAMPVASDGARDSKVKRLEVLTSRRITVKEKAFIPAISPQEVNCNAVVFFKASIAEKTKASGKKSISTKSKPGTKADIKRTELSDKAKKEIGHWGESLIYHKLMQHYKDKYHHVEIMETPDGFRLRGKKTIEGAERDIEVSVKWYNKLKESYKPLDFKITKELAGKKTKRYIEVKTTTADKSHSAHFSEHEVKSMLDYGKKYRIYRVFNAGSTEGLRIEKIKDPFNKIKKGMIAAAFDMAI